MCVFSSKTHEQSFNYPFRPHYYKCCRAYDGKNALNVNFCVDITDTSNKNSNGLTYGYLAKGSKEMVQMNYDCEN